MKPQTKTKPFAGAAVLSVLLATSLLITADEPVSEIDPSGDQYAAVDTDDGTDGEINYTTPTVPTPNCPDDITEGPIDYFWDFGPLDGTDNGDGTATIKTDMDGTYQVTVYCQQQFLQVSDGTTYEEQTQPTQ